MHLILSLRRYREGFGVVADAETAAFYHRLPSRVTAEEFHVIGAQSVVETDRIDDNTAPEVCQYCQYIGIILDRETSLY